MAEMMDGNKAWAMVVAATMTVEPDALMELAQSLVDDQVDEDGSINALMAESNADEWACDDVAFTKITLTPDQVVGEFVFNMLGEQIPDKMATYTSITGTAVVTVRPHGEYEFKVLTAEPNTASDLETFEEIDEEERLKSLDEFDEDEFEDEPDDEPA